MRLNLLFPNNANLDKLLHLKFGQTRLTKMKRVLYNSTEAIHTSQLNYQTANN